MATGKIVPSRIDLAKLCDNNPTMIRAFEFLFDNTNIELLSKIEDIQSSKLDDSNSYFLNQKTDLEKKIEEIDSRINEIYFLIINGQQKEVVENFVFDKDIDNVIKCENDFLYLNEIQNLKKQIDNINSIIGS